ncbi:MAG: PH domain-containing protein [Eggerthellaceae bacterium]|nr:PH domain-containing protein [Eggerthellaceae bacterium]
MDLSENRYNVHKSFILLGSIRTGLTLSVVLAASVLPGVLQSVFRAIGGESSFTPNTWIVALAIVGGILAILLISWLATLVYNAIAYKHLYYVFEKDEFSVHRGILQKRHVHVPYGRVQSVNQTASLLQRAAGVCTVNIDTAGGASNKAIMIPYVTKEDADLLRMELFARKHAVALISEGKQEEADALLAAMAQKRATGQEFSVSGALLGVSDALGNTVAGMTDQTKPIDNALDKLNIWNETTGVFGGSTVEMEAASYEHGLNNKQIFFSAISNSRSLFAASAIVIASVLVVIATVFEAVPSSIWEDEGFTRFLAIFGGSFASFILAGFLATVLIVWIIDLLVTTLSYGGFKARRRGSRIEVERGLLSHQIDGLDIDRVQSVIISQSLVKRILGYCEIGLGKIEAVNQSETGTNNTNVPGKGGVLVVHPFVKLADVASVLEGLVPEFADTPEASIELPKCAIRRAIVRRGFIRNPFFWGGVFAAIPHVILVSGFTGGSYMALIDNLAFVWYAICAFGIGIVIADAILWAKGSAFGYNKSFMCIKTAGITVKSVCMPRSKMQFAILASNPFQRHAKTKTIAFKSAAGVGGTMISLYDVEENDAASWFEYAMPGKAASA